MHYSVQLMFGQLIHTLSIVLTRHVKASTNLWTSNQKLSRRLQVIDDVFIKVPLRDNSLQTQDSYDIVCTKFDLMTVVFGLHT